MPPLRFKRMSALRVAITHSHWRYVEAIARHWPADLIEPVYAGFTPRAILAAARSADLLHIHWPEWLFDGFLTEPAAWAERIATLADDLSLPAMPPVVWTQHNRRPHLGDERAGLAGYQALARVVDAAIHHTAWGERVMRHELPFRPDCVHAVIPHPHFGELRTPLDPPTRADAEAALGLAPCACRLGLVGHWRPEKRNEMAVDAFLDAAPPGFELLNTAAAPGTPAISDPRVRTLPFDGEVERSIFNTYLTAVDALIVAIAPDRALTSAAPADAVGHGLAVIASDWPFLTETLAGHAIAFGRTRDDLARCLAGLTPERVRASGDAIAGLSAALSPARVAQRTADLYRSLVAGSPATPAAGQHPAAAPAGSQH